MLSSYCLYIFKNCAILFCRPSPPKLFDHQGSKHGTLNGGGISLLKTALTLQKKKQQKQQQQQQQQQQQKKFSEVHLECNNNHNHDGLVKMDVDASEAKSSPVASIVAGASKELQQQQSSSSTPPRLLPPPPPPPPPSATSIIPPSVTNALHVYALATRYTRWIYM